VKKTYIDRKRSDNSKIFLDDKLTENKILRELIREKLGVSEKDLQKLVKERKEIFLPISIFKNKLSTLEIVVSYLKDHHELTLTSISRLLSRDVKTIWSAYDRAKKKKITLDSSDDSICIPVKTFSDRRFSMLESLVNYLHVNRLLRFSTIAEMLQLDQATVWTANKRYNIKNG